MTTIPGFWDVGPHEPIPIEGTWRAFVREIGGTVVEDVIPEPRNFENADFLFATAGAVIELKEIETEFSNAPGFLQRFDILMNRLVKEDPNWRPLLFGGTGNYPTWFYPEFIRIFRPPISRILKKANRQIRETKIHFNIQKPSGILLFANDGFTAIGPNPICALASEMLMHSYSSIDCFVYLTVNRYIEFPDSEVPRLLWAPTYSNRAPDSTVKFIDDLGRKWFDYLERVIGPFTDRVEEAQRQDSLYGSKAIVVPGERGT
jgi:hypothetical protein